MCTKETFPAFSRTIHPETVRRRLKETQIYARRPYKGPVLSPKQGMHRLQWPRRHVRWTRNHWAEVLFCDESRFSSNIADWWKGVWCQRRERYADCCVMQHHRWGRSVHVWTGIASNHRTPFAHLRQAVTTR